MPERALPPTPWTLRPYQVEALRAIASAWHEGHQRTMLVLATGLGKCLGRGTPVLMFDGTIRAVEDVQTGDLLMGPDSRPRRVVSTCTGREALYRVTPTKGDPYVVNESHILSLKITNSRPLRFRGERVENGAIVNVNVRDYLASNRSFKHRAKGWRAAVDFEPQPLHPDLPPYILGMWLGDGTSRGPSVTSVDPEIVAELKAYAASRGMSIRSASTGDRCEVHHVTTGVPSLGRGHETNPMTKALRALGLLGNKHVPHAYLTASRADRLELLAGLMDTDGSAIPRGGFDYVSKVEALAGAVCFLARSVGLAAYKRACRKVCANNGVEGTYYRVQISGDCEIVPCRIPRKRSPARQQKKSVLVTGIHVEPIGEGDYFGFQIDGPDRLFLLGDFTVTHNTTVFAEVARRRTMAGRKPTLVLAHRIELVDQAAERLRGAGLGVSIENGDRQAFPFAMLDADCVVATVQTLKGKRLTKWPTDYFGTVVCDEAHHAAAASYRAILDRFDAHHLGVTATPDRGDQIAIGHVYPHLAYEYGIRAGIEGGYLAPIRSLAIDTPSVDLSSVRTTKQEHGRDLSADDLAAAMRGEAQLHELAAPIAREAGDRQTLVFVPSVEIAHALAEVLSAYVGASKVRSLDGGSDKSTRADVLAAYQRGDVRVLVNCALFTEGFDAPATSCVAIARPTKSRALYAQMVGRGTRLAEGKADCLVLNLAPANCRHSLVGPTDLFDGLDLPEDIAEEVRTAVERGEPVLKAISDAEDAAREREERLARDRERARIVADVHYRRTAVDPFAELDLDIADTDRRGPRATDRQAEVLERAGFKAANRLSRREAGKILDELTRRRQNGLCTVKQMRTLRKAGLRGDLTFDEARAALDALAGNRWRMTAEIAERWGDAA